MYCTQSAGFEKLDMFALFLCCLLLKNGRHHLEHEHASNSNHACNHGPSDGPSMSTDGGVADNATYELPYRSRQQIAQTIQIRKANSLVLAKIAGDQTWTLVELK